MSQTPTIEIEMRPVLPMQTIVIAEKGKLYPFAHIMTPTFEPQDIGEEEYSKGLLIVNAVNSYQAMLEALELIADAYVGEQSAQGQLEAVTKLAQKVIAQATGQEVST